MPPQVLVFMTAAQALLALTPSVIAFGATMRNWIKDLFEQGIINSQQQDQLYARVDVICKAALNETPAPAWEVEPDPT